MDFIVPNLKEPVEEYLSQYHDLFASDQARQHFGYYVMGLLSDTHRKNIWQIMRKVVEGRYQAGHHFLWGSPWDADEVNKRRLILWQGDKITAMKEDGWFIQDDTGQERRLRGKEKKEKTKRLYGGRDGVARQYIGDVGKVSEGLVFVSTLYADDEKESGIVCDLYWLEKARLKLSCSERKKERERDKIEIAVKQLEWGKEKENVGGEKPRGVSVDSWYGSSPRYLNYIHDEWEGVYVVCSRHPSQPNLVLWVAKGEGLA